MVVTPLEDKPAWRARLLAARAAVPAPVQAAEARALASWLGALSRSGLSSHPSLVSGNGHQNALNRSRAGRPGDRGAGGGTDVGGVRGWPGVGGAPGATVCAYYPVGSEPGSALMLDALVAAGWRVLLPVVAGAGPLDWAEYGGSYGSSGLARGPYGLVEPVGPRLGAAALSQAVLVLVPALAVDRRGVRLGRGGGYYDRSLPLAAPDAALVAVVRDTELVPRLPADPHDVPMTAALTPTAAITPLPC